VIADGGKMKTCDCARMALGLADEIEKLNLGLFGKDMIDSRIDHFKKLCGIPDDEIKLIKRAVADGIKEALDIRIAELLPSTLPADNKRAKAAKHFRLAKEWVFVAALKKIRGK